LLASRAKYATTNTVTENGEIMSAFLPKQSNAGKHRIERI
jgi:hypothetical protein